MKRSLYVIFAICILSSVPAWAADFKVIGTGDATDASCDADGNCTSLRAAISAANGLPDKGVINVPKGEYSLDKANGSLTISAEADIIGAGKDDTILTGTSDFYKSMLVISAGAVVNIQGIKFTGNNSGSNKGGAVNNAGTLILKGCDISANITNYSGGGIYNSGKLLLENSTIDGNNSKQGGGGISNSLGTVELKQSTVSNNTTLASGGGVNNMQGVVSVVNSTISGNKADYDGGGFAAHSKTGSISIFNSTITENMADEDKDAKGYGGGCFVSGANNTMFNSIVAKNKIGDSKDSYAVDCMGAFNKIKYSILGIGSTNCLITDATGNKIGTTLIPIDPKLAALDYYGGSTQTHDLLKDSPAIDAGDPVTEGDLVGCVDDEGILLIIDQRGVLKPLGAQCDMGAVEYQSCGDGYLYDVEECDDGNTDSTDSCVECKMAICGDGFVLTGSEECDDGNADNEDTCVAECKMAGCGDGFLLVGDEACDDGNAVDGDGCDNNCKPTGCGNGVIAANEQCDDGNIEDGDDCDGNCTATACGNGIITGGEECDDGNKINSDDCLDTCKVAVCGDGVLQEGVEQCDDGNVTDNDGCSSVCAKEAETKEVAPASSTDSAAADEDGDGVEDAKDNCASKANADQKDSDSDGTGDECDDTPTGSVSDAKDEGDDADGNGAQPSGGAGEDEGESTKASGGCGLIR